MSRHLVIRVMAPNVQEVTLAPCDCLDTEIICQYCQRILSPRGGHEVTHQHHQGHYEPHAVHLLALLVTENPNPSHKPNPILRMLTWLSVLSVLSLGPGSASPHVSWPPGLPRNCRVHWHQFPPGRAPLESPSESEPGRGGAPGDIRDEKNVQPQPVTRHFLLNLLHF